MLPTSSLSIGDKTNLQVCILNAVRYVYIHTNDTGGSLRLHLSSLGQELKFCFANLEFKLPRQSCDVRTKNKQKIGAMRRAS